MLDIIMDTLIDSLKLLPFLFITFLLMEYLEVRINNKMEKKVQTSGKYGPIIGGFLGAFPQCGFSVSATHLYATRIITMGTLISIYLSTSDEMLPILISEGANIDVIIKIIAIKIIVGIISGIIIDFIYRNQKAKKIDIKDFCRDEHCDCHHGHNHGILVPAFKHTINILLFITIISFILNLGLSYVDQKTISRLFMSNSILGPFLASIIGLIPNCGASVILTELYLNNVISFASVISGLLSASGVGLLVLFRVNKDKRENIKILLYIYFIGVAVGLIMQLVSYVA